jgi:uncharacterized RDD family membrane protein YckC
MAEPCPKCGAPIAADDEACPHCGVAPALYRAYMSALATPPAAATGEEAGRAAVAPVLAGFWRRALALVVDYGVLLVAQVSFELLVSAIWGDGGRVLRAARRGFPVVFALAYVVLCHWATGQTLGKAALGARVVARYGAPPRLSMAVRRAVVWALCLLPAGLPMLLVAARRDRRGLHDLAAGTRVERVPGRA